MFTLCHGTWLDDEVNNFFMELLHDRTPVQQQQSAKVHYFPAGFYSMSN